MEGDLGGDTSLNPFKAPDRCRFGPFEVDFTTAELRKSGLRIRIQEQPLRILQTLLERPGELVTRDDLKARLWPSDTFVDFERSVNAAVAKLRQALGDSAEQPRYVETVARRGYRLIQPVKILPPAPDGSYQPDLIPEPSPRSKSQERTLLATGALAILVVAFATGYILREPRAETRSVRFVLPPPQGTRIHPGSAVSPDGSKIAFVAFDSSGRKSLWVRAVDSEALLRLENTDGALLPFWSPDSQDIGFFADGKLKRIQAAGGSPQIICDQQFPEGGTWDRNGVILFSQAGQLYRVSAAGGGAALLGQLDQTHSEIAQTWPEFLPDGRHFIYYSHRDGNSGGSSGIFLGSLDSAGRKFILRTEQRAAFALPNFILFVRDGSLLAQPLDLHQFQLTGQSVSVAESVTVRFEGIWLWPRVTGLPISGGPAAFSVSDNGVLLYHSGLPQKRQLAWYSRNGKRLGAVDEPREYTSLRLSPDDRFAVLTVRNSKLDEWRNWNLWLLNTSTNVLSRLSFGEGRDADPVWSPDSRRLVYGAFAWQDKKIDLMEITLGQPSPVLFYSDGRSNKPEAWSPDGRSVLYRRDEVVLLNLPTQSDRKPKVLIDSPFMKGGFRFSPDGRWLAYSFTESSRYADYGTARETPTPEIYIAAFPAMTQIQRVSTAGGCAPHWRRDGRELFYVSQHGTVMSVDIKAAGARLETGTPRPLFQLAIGDTSYCSARYDVTGDGEKFLVMEASSSADEQMHIVTNWDAALRR
jgi:Tol biopolymer transport system component/DNA-binding winged helix-turn-helix (wHTH) protein